MKRKGLLIGMIVLGSMLFSHSLFAESPPKKKASPGDYGNLILGNYAEKYEPRYLKKVVFPHWFHRIRFRCKVCHSDVGFTMKAGMMLLDLPLLIENLSVANTGEIHNHITRFNRLVK